MIHDPAIKKLFEEYEKAFSALDVERQVDLFADAFISAGPKGAVASSKDEFRAFARKASEFYKNIGQESAHVLSLDETQISDEYSAVKVHWGVTFQKTGNKLVEFDVTYIVQKTGDEPKIVMFVAHEDEEEAMKGLGLLEK